MAGFTCSTCGDEHDLFEGGEPLADLDAPVLAELDFDPSVQGTPRPGELPEQMRALGETTHERVEAFVLVSDHDPSPVRSFLASLSGEDLGPPDRPAVARVRLSPGPRQGRIGSPTLRSAIVGS